MKACKKCGSTTNEFYVAKGRKDGLQSNCKQCVLLEMKERYARDPERSKAIRRARYVKNPEPYRARSRAAYDLTRARVQNQKLYFGLPPGRYEEMLQSQNGVCAICKREETQRRKGQLKRLAIDHDHSCCPGVKSCGKCVRGLVCTRCNQGMGHFGDSCELLLATVDYLSAHVVKHFKVA